MQRHPSLPLILPGRNWHPRIDEMQVVIEYPTKGKLRARPVVKRSNARCTGKYPGLRAGRMVQYESKHERNAMKLLDTCPSVHTYREQPCAIHYGWPDDMRTHFPDLLVFTAHHGKEFWEIKEAAEAVEPEVAYRSALMTHLLPRHGFGYRLVIAESLMEGARLANAHLLLKLGRKPVTPLQRERLRQLFQQYESLPWAALVLDEHGRDMRPQICRLILEGVLAFDIDQPLTDATHIRWVFDQLNEGEKSWHSLVSYKVH